MIVFFTWKRYKPRNGNMKEGPKYMIMLTRKRRFAIEERKSQETYCPRNLKGNQEANSIISQKWRYINEELEIEPLERNAKYRLLEKLEEK